MLCPHPCLFWTISSGCCCIKLLSLLPCSHGALAPYEQPNSPAFHVPFRAAGMRKLCLQTGAELHRHPPASLTSTWVSFPSHKRCKVRIPWLQPSFNTHTHTHTKDWREHLCGHWEKIPQVGNISARTHLLCGQQLTTY